MNSVLRDGTNRNEGDQVQIPHDSPFSGGHTSNRAEGALNLQALSVLCTNLSNRVLALEFIKDAQAAKISALKSRIKKLEKKCKPSISHHMAWLKTVHNTVFDDQDADHGMEYMDTEEAVDEGRQSGETREVKLIDDTEVVKDKGSNIDAARQEDSVVEPRTPPKTISIFDDEDITMVQTLIKMKEEKAKEKGVSFKDIKDSSRRPERSILTLKPLLIIDPKDKGKGVLKESPRQDQASVDYIASLYDEVQAKIDASEELATRLQLEEREMYTIEERSKLLAEFFKRRKKLLAKERVVVVRNKPPTRTQLRSLMMTYLKHTGEKMIDKMKKAAGMDEEEVPEETESTKVEVKQEGQEKQLRASLNIVPGEEEEIDYEVLGTSTKIHMLAERRYPLIRETLERMMELRLTAESEGEAQWEALAILDSNRLIMPVTRQGTNDAMTPESIQAMIDRAIQRNSTHTQDDASQNSGGGPRRPVQPARVCSYTDFMKCQPLNFKGTKGVVGLSQWLEKMESVFHISGCAIDNQVKFATCTLLGAALTWWNGHVRTLGHDAAYAMTWGTLKKKLTNKYCPKGEIKKLEIELWNLRVGGNDVAAYTQRFQELALMFTKFLTDETEKVDKYISGLPDNIHGNVMSARPKTLDDAIELANDLTDQKLRTYAERQTRAYTVGPGEKKAYTGNLPLCTKCNYHHTGQCAPKCGNCKRYGHATNDCWVNTNNNNNKNKNQKAGAAADRMLHLDNTGHIKNELPKIEDRGNWLGNGIAKEVLMLWEVEMLDRRTLLHPSALINIIPTTLESHYDVELSDGKIIGVNTIIRGCTLNFMNHPFNIDLMSVPLGSFDVIIGMDWLTKYHGVIICDEKIVCLRDLSIQRDVMSFWHTLPRRKPKTSQRESDIVRDIPKVFSEDLLGIPPARQVEFQIDLVPGVALVAWAPYRLAPSEMKELAEQLQELSDMDL
ncbi:putative reverse transcriptase domain-containing protein [Tanacetum coccineum]